MSSWVGPTPPEVITKSWVRADAETSSAIGLYSSGTTLIRLSVTPIRRNSRAAKYAFVSCTLPDRISFPTTTMAQLRSRIVHTAAWHIIAARRKPPQAPSAGPAGALRLSVIDIRGPIVQEFAQPIFEARFDLPDTL